MNEWISIKDEIPTGTVLVFNRRGRGKAFDIAIADCCYVSPDGKTCFRTNRNHSYSHVTHWMPLPEPPEEETKDDGDS